MCKQILKCYLLNNNNSYFYSISCELCSYIIEVATANGLGRDFGGKLIYPFFLKKKNEYNNKDKFYQLEMDMFYLIAVNNISVVLRRVFLC